MLSDYLITICICLVTILLYRYIDPNKDVERFYHWNNKYLYLLLNFVNVVIMVSLATNIKSLLSEIKKRYLKRGFNLDFIRGK